MERKELKQKKQGWANEDEEEEEDAVDLDDSQKHQPPNVSPMVPCQKEAYGGGLYGKDDDGGGGMTKDKEKQPTRKKAAASDTQSADGPVEVTVQPKQKPPPSSGDRDIDITGQSYIQ